MHFLACLLPLLAAAAALPSGNPRYTAWSNGQVYEPTRTSSEIVQLFRHLGDENVAVAIADEFQSLNIDPAMPFRKLNAHKTWLAVQKIVSIVVPNVVPESCGETFALQSFLGFGRHYWNELLEKNLLHAMQECNQLVNISRLADSAVSAQSPISENAFAFIEQIKMAGIENALPKMVRPSYEREPTLEQEIRYSTNSLANQIARDIEAGAWTGMGSIRTPRNVPEWEQIKEVQRAVIDELDRKLTAVISGSSANADFLLMSKFFKTLRTVIEIEGAKDKSVGHVLQKIASLCQTELAALYESGRTCQMSGSITTAHVAIQEMIAYMKQGYLVTVDSFPLSPLAKAEILRKTKVTLPAMADAMMVLEKAYNPSNYPEFFLVLLGEVKQHLAIVHTVSKMVETVVEERISFPFVNTPSSVFERESTSTTPLLKIVLRTCAMQMVKMDLAPQEIEIVLRNTVRALTTSTTSMELRQIKGFYSAVY